MRAPLESGQVKHASREGPSKDLGIEVRVVQEKKWGA